MPPQAPAAMSSSPQRLALFHTIGKVSPFCLNFCWVSYYNNKSFSNFSLSQCPLQSWGPPLELRLHPYKWPQDYSTGAAILLHGAKTQLLSVTPSRPSKPIPCGSLTYISEFGCHLEMQHRPPLDHSVCVLTLKIYVPDFTSGTLLLLTTAHLTGPS